MVPKPRRLLARQRGPPSVACWRVPFSPAFCNIPPASVATALSRVCTFFERLRLPTLPPREPRLVVELQLPRSLQRRHARRNPAHEAHLATRIVRPSP